MAYSQLQLFTITADGGGYTGLLLVPFQDPQETFLRVGLFEHNGKSEWLKSTLEREIIIR